MQVRDEIQFPDGQGLVDRLNCLSAWCKVTVLSLKICGLGRTGAESLTEAIASFLSASLVELDLEGNSIETAEGGRLQRHCDSTTPLRRST